MTPRARRKEQGVALVVTVIVVAMLAVVGVAMMQSTSIDRASSRSVANYFRAQLAAEAGLAEAMALIQQNANNFAYVSGAEPNETGYRTFVRPLEENNGAWAFAGADKVYLDSGEASGEDAAGFLVTGTPDDPGIEQKAAWKEMELEEPKTGETNRFAFWVDDGSAKQNLGWWGGELEPGTGNALTNLAQLTPYITDISGMSPSEFPAGALDALVAERALALTNLVIDDVEIDSVSLSFDLPTVPTINLLDDSLEGRVGTYFFTSSSSTGATTPKEKPKLNMAALARYIENLNSDQGAGSPKVELVDDLLKEEPANAAEWGGGSFNWLAESKKYSDAEQKQIVANIIDYLDEDLIPTMDSVDAPNYMGVEMKLQADGKVRGHPYINFLGGGLIFNRSVGGEVNSTRVLATLGLAYPWQASALTADYEPELTIAMQGTAVNGNRGTDAQNYFTTSLNEQLTTTPVSSFGAFSGYSFPGPTSANNNYATPFSGFSTGAWAQRQPTNFTLNNLVYRVTSVRLKFTPSDGTGPAYIQVLPAGLSITQNPTSITAGGGLGSLIVKFTEPTYSQTPNLHLSGDPRLGFKSSSWKNFPSQGGKSIDIPTPQGAVDITSGVGADWDEAQGMPPDASWYKSSSVTNHFNRSSQRGMSSIGELGYIWTGKPWQTLNLLKTDKPATADWNLLDYVAAGRLASADGSDAAEGGTPVPTLPLSARDPKAPLVGGLVAQGGVNVNTRKFPTLKALLASSTGTDAEAAEALMSAESASQPSAYGEIAALTAAVPSIVKGGGTYKFQREAVQRAMANTAVNHSRVFTVYSKGEYRMGNSVSRAQLEADIFVDVDPETKQPKIQVISQKFL